MSRAHFSHDSKKSQLLTVQVYTRENRWVGFLANKRGESLDRLHQASTR